MKKTTLLIGNTDGIGLEMTSELLNQGHRVIGISRSPAKISHPNYSHIQQDVAANNFRAVLAESLDSIPQLDLGIYLAGIGHELKLADLKAETKVFEVNLMGAVITTELVLEKMQRQKSGHFIGISSLGDMLISPESPSYTASKIGLSRYWEGLALALKNKKSPVKISNVRFGFVDTKMAKAPLKPLQLTRKEAVLFLQNVIAKPRIRASRPKLMIPLVGMVGLGAKLKVIFE